MYLNSLITTAIAEKRQKGLVFCSRQEEARELAKLFSQAGHPSRALTNEDSQKKAC